MKKFVVEIVKSCCKHDLLDLSANISFFALISLLPLCMIFVAVLGYVMGSGETVTELANTLTDMIPGAKDLLLSNIQNLVKTKSSIGIWGISVLFLASIMLFGSLERAFGKIFEVEKKRGFFHSNLIAIVVIFLILIFLFLPSTIHLVESFLIKYGYSLPLGNYLAGKAFFVVFAVLSFVIIVKISTNCKIYFRNALVGGILYASGITIAKYLFHWYMLFAFDKYNVIYGSLTAVILTVFWIYYLVNILLISSEVVAYLQRRVN